MLKYSDARLTHQNLHADFYCLDALHSFGRQILLWPVQFGLDNQDACLRFAKI